MKSEKQMRWKYRIYVTLWNLYSVLLFPIRRILHHRIQESVTTKETDFHIYWLFDYLEDCIKNNTPVYFRSNTFNLYIHMGNSYVISIWIRNSPFGDMDICLYEGNRIVDSNLWGFDESIKEHPKSHIAFKMRRVCKKILSKNENRMNEYDSAQIVTRESCSITPDILKSMMVENYWRTYEK